jgi:uncharacterized protein YndB with AHSA1/START domain
LELEVQSMLVRRELDASPEAVWHAFTNPDALSAWYHPVGFSTPRASVVSETFVGGKWSASVVVPVDGSEHHFFGRYRLVDAPNLLEYSMYYAEGDGIADAKEDGPAGNVWVVIERQASGSQVTYLGTALLPAGEGKAAQAGMESYFDSLAEYLANEAS